MGLKVAVSPFFGGEAWLDEATGILFESSKYGNLSIYDLSYIDSSKLEGIHKAVRLNALILVEGDLDITTINVVKEEKIEEVKGVEAEVVTEVIESEVVEVVAEVPVKKSTGKKK